MKIPRQLYFNYDSKLEINKDKEYVLKKLEYFLKTDPNTFGKVRNNEFMFMHKNLLPKIYRFSLVYFSGQIIQHDNTTILNIRHRLTAPFYYIYIIAGLIIPIMYIFNVDGFYDSFSVIPIFIFNPLFAPILIYLMLLIYYLFKINNVKIVLQRFEKKIE